MKVGARLDIPEFKASIPQFASADPAPPWSTINTSKLQYA